MRQIFTTLLISLAFGAILQAQPKFIISDAQANTGETVSIDFTVEDFTSIIGLQFSINWDQTVLTFESVSNINTSVAFLNESAFNPFPEDGNLIVQWFDQNIQGQSLPNGTVLFTMNFTVIGTDGSSTQIIISDAPRAIEVIDVNVASIGLTSEGGNVTIGEGGTPPVGLAVTSGSVEAGQQVCVQVEVSNFNNISGMQFSMNWDPALLTFAEVTNFNLQGMSIETFTLDDVANGNIRMQWLSPSGIGISQPNGTAIFDICFNAIGANGSSAAVSITNSPTPIEVADNDNNPLPTNVSNGLITITSGMTGGGDCDVEGFAMILPTIQAENGTNVCINITVKDFVDMLSFSGTIVYDQTVLANPEATAELSGVLFNLTQSSLGTIPFLWTDAAVSGVTLDDNSSIGQICFDVIGADGAATNLQFTDDVTGREASNLGGAIPFGQCDGAFTVGMMVVNNPTIMAETVEPTCEDSNGSIDVTVTGVEGTIRFQWSQAGVIIASSEDLNNLGPGTYDVTVFDESNTAILMQSYTLMATVPGINGSITDVDDNTAGAIDITVTGGAGGNVYMWSNGATTEDLSGLTAGMYTVTVVDASGCEAEATFTVEDNSSMGGMLSVSLDPSDYNGVGVSCFGEQDGTLTANVLNGVEPLTFAWSNGETTQSITGLAAGVYTVTVTSGDGSTASAEFTLTEPEQIEIDIEVTESTNDNGTANAMVSGGTPPYSYLWNDGNPGSTVAFISGLAEGSYTVIVTDENNCTVSESALVPGPFECFSTANGVITPNNDGLNEFLVIGCAEDVENELEIYNRYGELVFTATNYVNDWGGTDLAGSPLPDGGYFYVLRTMRAGETELFKGSVSLLRTLK